MTTNGRLTTWTGFRNEPELSVVSCQLSVVSCQLSVEPCHWSLARFEPAGAVALACEAGGSPSEHRRAQSSDFGVPEAREGVSLHRIVPRFRTRGISVTFGRTCDRRLITSARAVVSIIPASRISRTPAWPYAQSRKSDYFSVTCKSKSCKGVTL